MDKSTGGLGLRRIDDFNFSLLSKWAWRWRSEQSALWSQLIKAIYGNHGGFDSSMRAGQFRSIWRSILKNCQSRACLGLDVPGCIRRVVANGEDTKFWSDPWQDNLLPLQQVFPRLYALEMEKECSIADRRVVLNDCWSFRWLWQTPPRGRSASDLNRLEELLGSLKLVQNKSDSWSWSLAASGLYSVSGMYRHLSLLRTPIDPNRPQLQWNSWIPIKVNVMVWRAYLNRLPLVDNLLRRGISCGTSVCPLGCGVPESLEHTFCSCVNVGSLWKKVWAWWHLVFPPNFGWGFFRRFLAVRSFSNLAERAFHGVCGVTIWLIWNRRNKCIFGGASAVNEILEDDLLPRIQSKSLSWFKYRSRKFVGLWSDWISNPENVFP